ncbi:MAG: hypothetical protein ACK5JO_18995 [Halodesulfovibrio sp.]
MKVVLVNGNPHSKGRTYTVLGIVADTLDSEDISMPEQEARSTANFIR